VLLACLPPQSADGGAAPAATDVGEGPAPALNPIAWEIDIRFEDPQRIVVQTPRGAETYWYILYTVRNTSDRTQRFYPTFQIVTEDLRVYDTDVNVFPVVFGAIRELHKLQYPYLVSPTQAIGDLKTGEDNARESVAIWREIDLTLNNYSVFIAGLSGEAYAVRNPAYDPAVKENGKVELEIRAGGPTRATFESNPKLFTLRKTLQIDYTLPGSAETRGTVEPRRTRVRWVMR
jgi:hypothetical protein